MDAGSPPLEYAPAPPKRRKLVRRLLVLLLLIAVVTPLLYHRKPLTQRGHLLYWQRKCLIYTAPADQVVYEEDGYNPSPLLNRPGYSGWPVPPAANAGSTRWPIPPTIATLPAPPLAPYFTAGGLPPGWVAAPKGATAFLHERTSKTGHRRLVMIMRMPAHSAPFHYAFGLTPFVSTPAGITTGPTYHYPRTDAIIRVLSDWRFPPTDGLRFYAGQPDPGDSSRFTIRYDLSGGSGEVEGRLNDDGQTVSLKITNGPAIGTKWQTDVLIKD
jgi:hypothetical protein